MVCHVCEFAIELIYFQRSVSASLRCGTVEFLRGVFRDLLRTSSLVRCAKTTLSSSDILIANWICLRAMKSLKGFSEASNSAYKLNNVFKHSIGRFNYRTSV